MATSKRAAAAPKALRIEKSRVQFRTLIAANPNYFGNLIDSKFEPVEKIVGNTSYEQLTELGYNPQFKRLSATFDQQRAAGYGGDLCANGTSEYVRFYVNLGSGWQDAGIAAGEVHDIPIGKDCAGKNTHPLSHSVEVPYAPPRRWCTSPQLPRVRAILSWNVAPPAGQPDWKPVYGNVVECHIQIDKGFSFQFFAEELGKVELPLELAESIKYAIEEVSELPELPDPGPDPDPIVAPPALSIEQLAEQYLKPRNPDLQVEPKRFAFSAYEAIKQSSDSSPAALAQLGQSLGKFDVDIVDLAGLIEDTTGNISYEELEDVGLDWNQEKLVATYRVKKPSGFSGGLCSDGSNEYVTFWVDWKDKCKWQRVGTVAVKAYDFNKLPDGGLCYTAALPVDLSQVRRGCEQPRIGRVRAVLSWNTPSSKFDPDKLPTWGNRLDAHVLIPPGEVYTGVKPILTVVGGIGVPYISDVSGLTTAAAKFADNGLSADSLGRPCPFGGRVVVRGPSFPGHRYRVEVREAGTAVWTNLTTKIYVTSILGFGSYHTIDGDGWFKYLNYNQNFSGILAYFDTGGDAKWEIRLRIEGVPGSAEQVVQLDNTGPTVSVNITDPVGDCGMVTPGVLMKGRVNASDAYMGGWSVVIDGGPAGFGPVAATTGSSGNANTPVGGTEWTFDTTGLVQCGYVVRVHARDRAIVNSIGSNHHRSADVGFCVLKEN